MESSQNLPDGNGMETSPDEPQSFVGKTFISEEQLDSFIDELESTYHHMISLSASWIAARLP
jgi:hypothetical protein